MARLRDYTGYEGMSEDEKNRMRYKEMNEGHRKFFVDSWESYLEREEKVEIGSAVREMYDEWKSVIKDGKVYKELRDGKDVEEFDWSGLEKADKEREVWLREHEEDGKRYREDVRRYREESVKSELG